MKFAHKYFISSFYFVISLLIFIPAVEAIPIQFGNNYYEYIEVVDPFVGDNNSWETASIAAASSVYNGINGHLVTINSQGENDFLLSLVSVNYPSVAGAWLGGKATDGWLVGPEEGQSFNYSNWGGVEPNNDGYIYMNVGALYSGVDTGQWADDSQIQGLPEYPLDQVIGYFVEYEGAISVPEPTSLALLGLGLVGLGFSRGRK